MVRIKKSILLFVFISWSFFVNGQTNYYVSPGGINTNNGSFSSPWLTMQYGLNQLSAGDTLNVMSGTYTEKLNIPVSGITLRNFATDNPVIDANGISAQTAIIEISAISAILIQGLELKNSIMLDAQGILIDGNCQNITIRNCKIHDIHFSSDPNAPANASTNAQGIIVYGTHPSIATSGIRILNNQLYNCRLGYSEGIAVNGNVSGLEVSGNIVHDLTNIGIDIAGHEGTCSNAAYDQARNGSVKNNTVYNCVSPYATSGGIYVDGGKNIIIENNTSYLNGYGIEVGCENAGKTTDSITVRDNIFYNNQVCAIALGGYAYPGGSGKVKNSVIRNNTCYYNDFSNSGIGELYLSYSENTIIENNIFFTTSQDALAYSELTQPNLSFNYNIFYCQAGAGNLAIDWNGNSYSDYSSFVTSSGTNLNSNFGNPLFTSPNIAAPDFHILIGSPAINAGNPNFIPEIGEVDMDGENRANGIVDCGADEYYPTTGLNDKEINNISIKIYPNPCLNFITISSSDVLAEYILVYNELGQLINSFPVDNKTEITLNVSDFPSGLYYISAYDSDLKQISTHKFIKD